MLALGRFGEDALVLGRFQRALDLDPRARVVARASGGPIVRAGPGTLHLTIELSRPNAIVACDATKLVNRYVRPLLRGLTRSGATAHWFGRDWISVAHRPAGWVGFAHEASTGRSLVEAFVAVDTPFDVGPRASYLDKSPGTLSSIVGRAFDLDAIAANVARAYEEAYSGALARVAYAPVWADARRDEPAWAASVDEIVGAIAAGPDREGAFRVGGDLMASHDAVATLELAIAALPDHADTDAIGAEVNRALGAPGVVVEGVRSLASVRDAIFAARARQANQN